VNRRFGKREAEAADSSDLVAARSRLRRMLSIRQWKPPNGDECEPLGKDPLDRGGLSALNTRRTEQFKEKNNELALSQTGKVRLQVGKAAGVLHAEP
jgi:hypothetical protein